MVEHQSAIKIFALIRFVRFGIKITLKTMEKFYSWMVLEIFRIILMEDAVDCLMSFPDFLYAFQTQFFYEGNNGYP